MHAFQIDIARACLGFGIALACAVDCDIAGTSLDLEAALNSGGHDVAGAGGQLCVLVYAGVGDVARSGGGIEGRVGGASIT